MYREDCPCPKKECARHCYCDECRTFHGAKGKLPRCERPVKPSLLAQLKKSLAR